jgi:hypothetical protein
MGRAIVGAIVGYIVIIAIVIGGLFAAWAVLGGSGSFEGDGPYPSSAWNAAALASGFIAAIAGGWVARKLGRSALGVKILVGLMLVLGLYGALTAEASYQKRSAEAVAKPASELTFMEAGQVAKNPAWYNWVIPFVGVAGALLGGRGRE